MAWHVTNVTRIDAASQAQRTIYTAEYSGDLKLWEEDENGVRRTFTYDSLKRVRTLVQKGAPAAAAYGNPTTDVTNTFKVDPQGRTLVQAQQAGALRLTNSFTFDFSGRVRSQSDTDSALTTTDYSQGGRVTTITHPSGATEILAKYRDGRIHSRTGTAVVNEFYTYNILDDLEDDLWWIDNNWHAAYQRTYLNLAAADSPRWTETAYDCGDYPNFQRSPDFAPDALKVSATVRDDSGNPVVTIPYRGTGTVLSYDYMGNLWTSEDCPDAYPGYPGGRGRLQQWDSRFKNDSGTWYRVTTNLTYLADDDPTPTVLGVQEEQINNFAANEFSKIRSYDVDGNLTTTTTFIDRANKKITQVVDTPQSSLNATNITVNGLLQIESTATVASPTRHYYDGLGRETSVTTSLGFNTSKTYNQLGQVTNVVDLTGARTSYEYFSNGELGAGQVKCQTGPTRKKTYYSYTARGELARTWGDVPYPEERIYSDYGELVELHTFQADTGWNQPTWPSTTGPTNKTIWTYQPSSGLLLSKTDDADRSVQYTYTNGMVLSRTWARGVSSTNTYNSYGDLVAIEYTDSTPGVFLDNFSRAGLPRQIRDASGTNSLAYDYAGRLTLTTNIGGLMAGVAVSNRFDHLNGRDLLQVFAGSSTPIVSTGYGYDLYGRLATVTEGDLWASYGYVPNSDLLQTTTCKSNTTTVLTTTRSWEFGARLAAIVNEAGGTVVSSHAYKYDALNRRTRAYLEDGSLWAYDYNDRNELTGARHYWPDWAPVAGQQFGYAYDSIGNRTSALSGGDVNGWNPRETLYTANNLNQYTDVQTLGYKHIAGVAFATNTVTVNGDTADRRGEWFDHEIIINNASAPVWQNVSVSDGTPPTNGGFVFPKQQQTLTYDLDGNLSSDGIWTYEWDGENRLKGMSMTNASGIPNAQRKRLEFGYDFMNRRFRKVVKSWNGSAFSSTSTNLFVYDGWNLLVTVNGQLSPFNCFIWGQDLSGTTDGAGGVGGLLLFTDHSLDQPSSHFACFDGNGNLMALVNSLDKISSARYEYSAFGEVSRSTGPMALCNALQFSTKYADQESGLVYYGHRYYNPRLGRWVSRDPAGFVSSQNLYAHLRNRCLGSLDPDGLTEVATPPTGIWIIDTQIGNLLPETFKRLESDLEGRGYSSKYARGTGWRNQEAMWAQRQELALARALEAAERVAFAFAVVETVVHAALWANSGKAEEFLNDAKDYARHSLSGDVAYADLDAISMATGMMELTGRYESAYIVLDILLQ